MSLQKTKVVTRAILATILSSIIVVSTNANFKWLSTAERTTIKILIEKYNSKEELTSEDKLLFETLKESFDNRKNILNK